MTSEEPVKRAVSRISFFFATESLPPLPYTQVYAAKGAKFLFHYVELEADTIGLLFAHMSVHGAVIDGKKLLNAAAQSFVFWISQLGVGLQKLMCGFLRVVQDPNVSAEVSDVHFR